MTWAQRLKRVFNIDIEKCDACGGSVKVIVSFEPEVIDKILTHLALTGMTASSSHRCRLAHPGCSTDQG